MRRRSSNGENNRRSATSSSLKDCLPSSCLSSNTSKQHIHRAYGHNTTEKGGGTGGTDWLGAAAKILVATAAIMALSNRMGSGGGGGDSDNGGAAPTASTTTAATGTEKEGGGTRTAPAAVRLDSGRSIAPYLLPHTTPASSGLFDDYPLLSGLDMSDPNSLLPPLPFDPTALVLPPLAPGSYPSASLSPLVGPGSNLGHALRPRLLRPHGPPSRAYAAGQLPGMKMAWDPRDGGRTDRPILWDVPFSGGQVVRDVARVCHRLVTTGMRGVYDVKDGETELRIIYPGSSALSHPTPDLVPFVNADTSTVAGLSRARDLGLAFTNLADVIVTPLLYEADTLFDPTEPTGPRGRLFAVFRHPLDRAADLFYYAKSAHWEASYSPEIASMSIDQYAKSSLVDNNWMTRQLSGILEGDLTQEHLTVALEVLRTRFLVGLESDMDGSLDRFERYFGWTYRIDPVGQEACRTEFIRRGHDAVQHPSGNSGGGQKELVEGTEAYEAIFWQNQMDLEIYDYAVMLFREQGEFVAEVPGGSRGEAGGATCCVCDPPTFPAGFVCPGARGTTGVEG